MWGSPTPTGRAMRYRTSRASPGCGVWRHLSGVGGHFSGIGGVTYIPLICCTAAIYVFGCQFHQRLAPELHDEPVKAEIETLAKIHQGAGGQHAPGVSRPAWVTGSNFDEKE